MAAAAASLDGIIDTVSGGWVGNEWHTRQGLAVSWLRRAHPFVNARWRRLLLHCQSCGGPPV